ncbi:hypothetical protein CMO91_01770 [Candidatus Woesearchaeota archaeon]|nr:hypothetical protein [Candidatus Woesearchaeota archaeon]|tara:strand:- start:1206 stop:1784 length:579 start_codon:yes stop_codon:yes gene_type:complete
MTLIGRPRKPVEPTHGLKEFKVVDAKHQIIWGGGRNEVGAAYKAIRIGIVHREFYDKDPSEGPEVLEVIERSNVREENDVYLCFDRVGLDQHQGGIDDHAPQNIVSDYVLSSFGNLVHPTADRDFACDLAYEIVKLAVWQNNYGYTHEPRESVGAMAWAARLFCWNPYSFQGIGHSIAFQEALKRVDQSASA